MRTRCPQSQPFQSGRDSTDAGQTTRNPERRRLYRELEMRKFGFHGTSIRFVAQKAQEMIATKQVISSDNPTSNLVVCHLGSGASVTAVVDAVDPSLLGLACKSLNKMSTKP